jgi:flagellar hook-basal body complex protein FliE
MSIEAIAALNALSAIDTSRLAQLQSLPSTFDTLVSQLSGVNEQMQANAQALQSVALGETDNLHQVMMNLERTKLDFDLLLAVRNKVLDAYQELMRMQI